MSERKQVGWFIKRTPKQEPHPGTTLHAEAKTIYPTEEAATKAMRTMALNHGRYTYSVAPVFMRTEEDATKEPTK